MPSAYSVPMASDVLPEPDTPTTATVRHSGTSTSMSCRLLCRAPRTPMTRGSVPGTPRSLAAAPGKIWPLSQWSYGLLAGGSSSSSRSGARRALPGSAAALPMGGAHPTGSPPADRAGLVIRDPHPGAPAVSRVGGRLDEPLPRNEVVWNDRHFKSPGNVSGATGGGLSRCSLRPPFQLGLGLPGKRRAIPDVSAAASAFTRWPVSLEGHWKVDAGTSASTPLIATAMAVTSANLRRHHPPPLGPTDGLLYYLRRHQPNALFDIIHGNNAFVAGIPGHSAKPGYDLASASASPSSRRSPAKSPRRRRCNPTIRPRMVGQARSGPHLRPPAMIDQRERRPRVWSGQEPARIPAATPFRFTWRESDTRQESTPVPAAASSTAGHGPMIRPITCESAKAAKPPIVSTVAVLRPSLRNQVAIHTSPHAPSTSPPSGREPVVTATA